MATYSNMKKDAWMKTMESWGPSNLFRDSQRSNSSSLRNTGNFENSNDLSKTIKREKKRRRSSQNSSKDNSLIATQKPKADAALKLQKKNSAASTSLPPRPHTANGDIQTSKESKRSDTQNEPLRNSQGTENAYSNEESKPLFPGNQEQYYFLKSQPERNRDHAMAQTMSYTRRNEALMGTKPRMGYREYLSSTTVEEVQQSDFHKFSEAGEFIRTLLQLEEPAKEKKSKLYTLTKNITEASHLSKSFVPEGKSKGHLPGATSLHKLSGPSDRLKAIITIQKFVKGWLARKKFKVRYNRVQEYFRKQGKSIPLDKPVNEDAIDISLEFEAYDPKLTTTIDPKILKKEEQLRSLFSNPFYSKVREIFLNNDNMEVFMMSRVQQTYSEADIKSTFDIHREKSRPVEKQTKVQNFFGSYYEPQPAVEIKKDINSVISLFVEKNFVGVEGHAVAKSPQKTHKGLTVEDLFQARINEKKMRDESKIEALRTLSKFREHHKVPKADTKTTAADKFSPKKAPKGSSPKTREKDYEDDDSYSQNFEDESGSVSESIHYGKDSMRTSAVKESIRESLPITESIGKYQKSNDAIEESIRASISASKSAHLKDGLKRYDSSKSIQEEMPLSDSISEHIGERPSAKRTNLSKSIEEDLPEEIYSEKFDSYDDSGSNASPLKASPQKTAARSILKKSSKDLLNIDTQVKENNKLSSKEPESYLANQMTEKKSEKKREKEAKLSSFKETQRTQISPAREDLGRRFNQEATESMSDSESNDYVEVTKLRPPINYQLLQEPSRTAEILYANFKRELTKFDYIDQLTEKVSQLERNVTSMNNRKEIELFVQLHNRSNPSRPIAIPPSNPLETNLGRKFLEKQEKMEKDIKEINDQLKIITQALLGARSEDNVSRSSRSSRSIRREKIQIKPKDRKKVEEKKEEKKTQIIEKKPEIKPEAKPEKIEEKPLTLEPKPLTLPGDNKPIKIENKLEEKKPFDVKKTEPAKSNLETKPTLDNKSATQTFPKFEPKTQVSASTKLTAQEPYSPFEKVDSVGDVVSEDIGEEFAPLSEEDEDTNASKFTSFLKPSDIKKDNKPFGTGEYKGFKFPKRDQPTISATTKTEETFETNKLEEEEKPKPLELKPATTAPTKKVELKLPFSVGGKANEPKQETPKKDSDEIEEEIDEEIVPDDDEIVSPKKRESFTKNPYKKDKKPFFPLQQQQPQQQQQKEQKAPTKATKDDEDEEYDLDSFDELSNAESTPKEKSAGQKFKEEPKKEAVTKSEKSEASIDESIPEFTEELELPSDRPTDKKPSRDILIKDESEEESKKKTGKSEEPLQLRDEKESKSTPRDKVLMRSLTPEEEEEADILASKDTEEISWQEGMGLESEERKGPAVNPMEEKANAIIQYALTKILDEIKTQELFPRRDLATLHKIEENLAMSDRLNFKHQHDEMLKASYPNEAEIKQLEEFQTSTEIRQKKFTSHRDYLEREIGKLVQKVKGADSRTVATILLHHAASDGTQKLSLFDKKPINDQSIIDGYQEMLSILATSEYREMVLRKMTAQEIEAKMITLTSTLAEKAKSMLLNRLGKSSKEGDPIYSTGPTRIADLLPMFLHKMSADEPDNFVEQNPDLQHDIEEAFEKFKEGLSDEVMEYLFEDLVGELEVIENNRKDLAAKAKKLAL